MANDKLNLNIHSLTNNLCLYYSILTDNIYQHLMEKALSAGHQGLKLSHALIIPQISNSGTRIIDIAKSQGVSKQAIGQIANELENLGYIMRTDDIHDKRSKKLILTDMGISLIRQAALFMSDVDHELNAKLGANQFNLLKQLSQKLFKSLGLKFPDAGSYTPEISYEPPLIVYASGLATELDLMLQAENRLKGHMPLKRSYWQVLEKINQKGVRINDLAELNGISKQAISQLANEIEKSGYITRIDDIADKRAKKLLLTSKGEQLISDTLISTETVEALLEQKIGHLAINKLKQCFQQYLVSEYSNDKQLIDATEEKFRSYLTQFIATLGENERTLWLSGNNESTTLSDYAIKKIRIMQL